MVSVIESICSEEFKSIVLSSKSLKEILDKLGVSYRGHSYYKLKSRIDREGLTGFYRSRIVKKIPNEEVFQQQSKFHGDLKKRFIEYTGNSDKCVLCGQLPIHNNIPLTLQLDHINGVHDDNRIANLRIVCPNCHTQTSTYGKRNSKSVTYETTYSKSDDDLVNFIGMLESIQVRELRQLCVESTIDEVCTKLGAIKRTEVISFCRRSGIIFSFGDVHRKKFEVEREELQNLIDNNSMVSVGRMFGVSDNAIKKRCIRLGVEIRKK